MFVRPSWKPRSLEDVYDLMERHPWGLLVSQSADGPLVTNVPWILDRSKGEHGLLRSHLARANAQSLALSLTREPVLAVLHGPSQYVSASWYPGRDMPSTVYYSAVHCYGSLKFHDEDELRSAVEELTERSEANIENGWHTDEIAESEITRRLPSILGFDLVIDRIEAKFKLGQDEPKRDALAVADRLLQSPNEATRSFGEQIRSYNIGRAE